jgi:hypothetical protein
LQLENNQATTSGFCRDSTLRFDPATCTLAGIHRHDRTTPRTPTKSWLVKRSEPDPGVVFDGRMQNVPAR